MLVIHDEQLSRQLQEIADSENRSVEDVLKSLLAQYPASAAGASQATDEAMRRVRSTAYAKARRYWHETGNSERLKLTDEELDEQFWLFDNEGIPRLKSERNSVNLIPGTSAWLAAHLDEIAFDTAEPLCHW